MIEKANKETVKQRNNSYRTELTLQNRASTVKSSSEKVREITEEQISDTYVEGTIDSMLPKKKANQ